jgi:Glycosyl transferase family 2
MASLEGRTHLPKNLLGTATAERLSVEFADLVVCEDRHTLEWMLDEGWSLPERRISSPDGWEAALRIPDSPRPAAPAETPLVAVVVPLHERTDYLRFCLDGLARQTYPRLEVVLVDDGSVSTGVKTLIAEVENRAWPWPLRVLRMPNGGVGAARNAGWRSTSAPLVTFVDDDDVPFDDLVSYLARSRLASGADVVAAGARFFRGDGPAVAGPSDVVRIPLGQPRELGLLSNQYGAQTCLWSRELLEQLGGFSTARGILEDWELLVRATLAGALIVGTPDPLWWFRQTPGGRYSANPRAIRRPAVWSVARVASGPLPDGLKLLPLLATGAYDELEERARLEKSRHRRLIGRTRMRLRRAREVRAQQGTSALVGHVLRYIVRSG